MRGHRSAQKRPKVARRFKAYLLSKVMSADPRESGDAGLIERRPESRWPRTAAPWRPPPSLGSALAVRSRGATVALPQALALVGVSREVRETAYRCQDPWQIHYPGLVLCETLGWTADF